MTIGVRSEVISIRAGVAIANVGATVDACWEAVLQGRRAFAPMSAFLPGCASGPPVAGIADWPGAPPAPEERAHRLAERLGADTRHALGNSGFDFSARKTSLLLATSHGDAGAVASLAECSLSGEPPLRSVCRAVMMDELTRVVRDALYPAIPARSISAACASATVATGLGRDQIQMGMFDDVVITSLDTLSRVAYAGFRQVGAMSAEGTRPFDRRRDGITIAEAAASFVLSRETPEAAASDPNGVLLRGYGETCDARHPVEPSVEGIRRAIEGALAEAQILPSAICAIYWHGTGTKQNDAAEAAVARAIFGERIPPSTSTKGTFGHAMGASSGLSILAACRTIQTGLLPPTAGLEDAEFPEMNFAMGSPVNVQRGPTLVVASGFGGISAALVLEPATRRIS